MSEFSAMSEGASGADGAGRQAGSSGGAQRPKWLQRVLFLVERVGSTLILASPGAGLGWLYAQRLLGLRADPAASPGTPAETWIALMTAVIILISARFAVTGARGRLPRPVGVVVFVGLCIAAAMLMLVVRSAGVDLADAPPVTPASGLGLRS